MPMLNFKKMFVEPIRKRRKRHTIRANRKIPIKRGDKLYLYCGARTKNCFKILDEPQTCTKALPIQIRIQGANSDPRIEIVVDHISLSKDEKESLAYADGFDSLQDMKLFWIREHTDRGKLMPMQVLFFEGQIIHW